MGYKQLSSNLIEYFQPIILTKYKIDRHNDEYKDVIEEYEEHTGVENKVIKAKMEKLKQSQNATQMANVQNDEKDSNDEEHEAVFGSIES